MPPTRCAPTNSRIIGGTLRTASAARFLSTWQRFCFGLTRKHQGKRRNSPMAVFARRTKSALVSTSHNITQCGLPEATGRVWCWAQQPHWLGNSSLTRAGPSRAHSYNAFLEGRVLTADSQRAQFATYSTQIAQLDNLLADPDAGLSPALILLRWRAEVSASRAAYRQAIDDLGRAVIGGDLGILDGRMWKFATASKGRSARRWRKSMPTPAGSPSATIHRGHRIGRHRPADNDLRDQRDTLIRELSSL